jgi:hypothetical protein
MSCYGGEVLQDLDGYEVVEFAKPVYWKPTQVTCLLCKALPYIDLLKIILDKLSPNP